LLNQLIIENPNADWKDLSAWKIPNRWTRDTFIPLRNSERYFRAFSNTPHIFNILITEYQDAESNRKLGEEISSPNSIAVVLTNNVGSVDVIPFTPWILAHRIGHAIQINRNLSFETEILKIVINLIETGFRVKTGIQLQSSNDIDLFFNYEGLNFNFLELASFFIDTQCGRNNRIVSDLDIFSELVAEYLIKGQVTLRQPTGWRIDLTGTTTVPGREKDARPFSWTYLELPEEEMENINFKINWLMRGQFERLMGKVISF